MTTKYAGWRPHRWFTTYACAGTLICSRCRKVKIIGNVPNVSEGCARTNDVVHSTHDEDTDTDPVHFRCAHAGAGLLVRLDGAGNVDVLFCARLLRSLDADAGLRYVHTSGCVGGCCDRRAVPTV